MMANMNQSNGVRMPYGKGRFGLLGEKVARFFFLKSGGENTVLIGKTDV